MSNVSYDDTLWMLVRSKASQLERLSWMQEQFPRANPARLASTEESIYSEILAFLSLMDDRGRGRVAGCDRPQNW